LNVETHAIDGIDASVSFGEGADLQHGNSIGSIENASNKNKKARQSLRLPGFVKF
jgi:hypothetical protein